MHLPIYFICKKFNFILKNQVLILSRSFVMLSRCFCWSCSLIYAWVSKESYASGVLQIMYVHCHLAVIEKLSEKVFLALLNQQRFVPTAQTWCAAALTTHNEWRQFSVLYVIGPSWFTPLFRACSVKLKAVSIICPHRAVLSKQLVMS